MLRDRDTQALIVAYSGEVEELYKQVEKDDMIDGPGYHPRRESSDFVYTRPSLAHNDIRPLLFSRLGKRLSGPVLAGREFSSAGLTHVLQALAVVFGGFMLLAPAGFVYLMGLSKAASYGVVVGFVVFFASTFAVAGVAFERVLVASSAYAAVLVATLFQVQVGGGPSCL